MIFTVILIGGFDMLGIKGIYYEIVDLTHSVIGEKFVRIFSVREETS